MTAKSDEQQCSLNQIIAVLSSFISVNFFLLPIDLVYSSLSSKKKYYFIFLIQHNCSLKIISLVLNIRFVTSFIIVIFMSISAYAKSITHPIKHSQFIAKNCALNEIKKTKIIRDVLEDLSLVTQKNEIIRLAGILFPDKASRKKARNEIAQMTIGRAISLFAPQSKRDRYQRIAAQVVLSISMGNKPIWLQERLVHDGSAMVLPSELDFPCAHHLLVAEEKARRVKHGFWANHHHKINRADDSALAQKTGSYQIVEGCVRSLGVRSYQTFLNFSDMWAVDLTVALSKAALRRFRKVGIKPAILEGNFIRVRGWLQYWNGPFIVVDFPAQIEILANANTYQCRKDKKQ